MAQTAKNAVYSKPKAGGAVWSALAGSTLPTDATTALDEAFEAWGYVSEDGIAENGSINSTTIKAYGGATVITIEGGNDITYVFTPIEYCNATVQKELYGGSNVETDTDGSVKSVKLTDEAHEQRVFVFEHVLSNGRIERAVLPSAQVTSIGTNTYSSGAALGPEVTVTPYPDASGVKAYKYQAKAA